MVRTLPRLTRWDTYSGCSTCWAPPGEACRSMRVVEANLRRRERAGTGSHKAATEQPVPLLARPHRGRPHVPGKVTRRRATHR